MKDLIQQLKRIDNKGYRAYKDLHGKYSFPDFDLFLDYVQGDPFASPSRLRIMIPKQKRGINQEWLQTAPRKIAAEDAIARSVGKAVGKNEISIKGSGKSGNIFFDRPGQEVLERSAVQLTSDTITICLSVGLPANGRRINGREAEKLFTKAIPELVRNSVFTIPDQMITEAIELADQQEAIREQMRQHNWIAFLANGSILPRESGISNRPMKQAVPFQSPAQSEVEVSIPHREEPIRGMAIEKGITLIVGGGYHGKSTMLQAIERGVYYHSKGDGREYVLTDPDAVKIRAEDGRKVTGVNISPFINNLPHKQQTTFFSTENASGSTSQAANVMEALEVGATTLLIDEDTSATNFMIRDHRMQKLVKKDQEPITPFIDKIKQMDEQLGVSTILVMGGSGDYFAVADKVIMLESYRPEDVTEKAKQIMNDTPLERDLDVTENFGNVTERYFLPQSLQTQKGKRAKVQAKGLSTILMGYNDIQFADTEQLVDPSQTRLIADIILHLDQRNVLGNKSLKDVVQYIDDQLNQKGIAAFSPFKNQHPGDIARPRKYEIAAVINRLRTAAVKHN
ncbi:putative ATPase of the ABC class [Oceanobacillus picturae]|uniref:ATPase of the ABC class n=1 Tax=Oceanobacillus picturae TaxID=171693 RepID=W9ABE2_9BACI|nr:ABC-ATPase domain-containing protein [Oceanobacillus picturae]CDO02798.1 putative ATPase of the ABC class [Oceanobacillus picturae]